MTETHTRAAVAAALVVALALGAAGMALVRPGPAEAQGAAPASSGRYMIVHSPHAREDMMLLDTATGRTWAALAITDVNTDPVAWEPVVQLNSDDDRKALVDKYGAKAE